MTNFWIEMPPSEISRLPSLVLVCDSKTGYCIRMLMAAVMPERMSL